MEKRISRSSTWLSTLALLLLLGFVSACGTSSGTAGGTAIPISSQASTYGCPNDTLVTTAPAKAAVVLGLKNNNSAVTVDKGDTVEVDLPFGHLWQGPDDLQGYMTMQTPSGYAFSASKMCVWRFTATSSGHLALRFFGRAICKKGAACPMYIMSVSFAITIR